jgi:poly-gamma-glutamate biosynthesis protein PgsC/CapC
MIVEYYFIGLIIGFLFYELTGVSPGGVIAPAYFSLFIFYPGRILSTLFIAFLVWGILLVLVKHFILYGRRRLLVAMILGFALKLLLEKTFLSPADLNIEIHSIGYIIPGLIANEMVRQKLVPTLSAIGLVTALISTVIIIIH